MTEQAESLEPSNSPIVRLAASNDGKYVIAVTGEDKCIRVLNLSAEGLLVLFSER